MRIPGLDRRLQPVVSVVVWLRFFGDVTVLPATLATSPSGVSMHGSSLWEVEHISAKALEHAARYMNTSLAHNTTDLCSLVTLRELLRSRVQALHIRLEAILEVHTEFVGTSRATRSVIEAVPAACRALASQGSLLRLSGVGKASLGFAVNKHCLPSGVANNSSERLWYRREKSDEFCTPQLRVTWSCVLEPGVRDFSPSNDDARKTICSASAAQPNNSCETLHAASPLLRWDVAVAKALDSALRNELQEGGQWVSPAITGRPV